MNSSSLDYYNGYSCLSFEVSGRFVVVELDAFGAAEAGQDLHAYQELR